MLTRPIYHQCWLLGGAVWPLPSQPASQPDRRTDNVAEETDASQPPGFISYFHNDISLVTEGQQAWREQRAPVSGPPGGRGGKDTSSRDGRGHRGSDPGVRAAASRSGSSGQRDIYGLFGSLFTEEPGRGPDVDPLGKGWGRWGGPSGWTTLGKCRLMISAPSVSELHESI